MREPHPEGCGFLIKNAGGGCYCDYFLWKNVLAEYACQCFLLLDVECSHAIMMKEMTSVTGNSSLALKENRGDLWAGK